MKAIAKRLVYGCAWLAVRPRLCGLAVTSWLLGRDEAFAKASESVAAVGGYWGLAVREAFYRSTLTRVGRHVHIGYGTVFSKRDAWVGDHVFLGRYCTVGRAVIRRHVLIADHVQILSGRHHHPQNAPHQPPLKLDGLRKDEAARQIAERRRRGRTGSESPISVTLGERTWVGGGAVVMADVGARAVVAAGAVVVKPVGHDMKVGGVPARTLESRERKAA